MSFVKSAVSYAGLQLTREVILPWKHLFLPPFPLHNFRLLQQSRPLSRICVLFLNPALSRAQAGIQGLNKALDRFDADRGARLSTVAYWWIKTDVRREHSRQMRVISVPENVENDMRHVYIAQKHYQKVIGR